MQLWSCVTHEGGRKGCGKPGGRIWSLGILWASARQNEDIEPSPCLWNYAGDRKHLIWDAKNLVRREEGLPDSRVFAVLQRTSGAPPLPRENRVCLTPEAGWNALGDAPATQEATGHGGASPELSLWQLPGPSCGQRGLLGMNRGEISVGRPQVFLKTCWALVPSERAVSSPGAAPLGPHSPGLRHLPLLPCDFLLLLHLGVFSGPQWPHQFPWRRA